MADLFFRVRASYDEAIECRRELKKVEEQIKNLDTDASPNKINALLSKHAELSAKWENNISSFGKFGASALQIFDKIGSAIKRDTKELDSVGDASERLLSTTQKRLLMEERIQENIKKQKASAEQRKSYLEEGLARNQASLQQREQRLKEKNGYKDEGFYSEEDRKSLEEARKHVENWLKPLKDVSAQIIDYNRQLEESNKRAGEHKAILENIKAPDIDLKSNIDDLTSQIETGEKTLDKLKKDLVDMETELSQRQTPQGAAKYFQESKDKMYSIFGDIESKKKEIDSLQSAVDSFNVSGQVAQQQQLESYAAELTENIKKEDDEIGRLTQKLSSLNEQSVLYKQTQDEIDFHLAEREKYVQLLQTTNTAIHDSQASIESEVRAQEERQSKIKELSADIGNLSTEYEKQKNIVNDPSANQKAIDGLQQEISKKKEQIELTARENQAMQDLLSQAQDVYYPDNAEKALTDIERLDDEFLKANKDVQELSDAMKQSLELENIETAKEKLSDISAKMQEIVEKSRELQSKKIVQQDIVRENTQKQKFDTANAEEYQKKIDEANKTIEEINNKLAENGREYVALKNEQAEYTQTLNDASGHQENIRTQIMAAREELARMIAEGKQGTPEFAEMAEQAGELRQQMQISSAAMDYFGNENRHMDTLKDTLQGVAGGFSVVTGVMGIFNKDAAEMEAIQTKIQSSLGVIIGLESVYAKVKNTSNIMLTIGAVQSWAAAKADAAATTAKEAGTIATIKATAAQSAFNLIAKANPYVLLVTAILSLVGGIYLLVKAYDKEMTEEEKAMQRHKEHTEIVRKQQKEWSDSVASSAARQIASYHRLQSKWEELGNNMSKKRKFIKDNQQAFQSLGFAVNSVSDAENFFVKNTDAVVSAITARAKAAAYQTLIQEEFERQIRAETYKTADTGNFKYTVSAGQKAKTGTNKAYTQAQSGGYTYQEGDIDANGNWTASGAKRFNAASERSRQKRSEQHKKDLAEQKKLSDERIKSYQDNAKKESDAAKNLLKNAGIKEYEGGKSGGGSGTTAAERAERERALLDKQARDRQRQAKDLEFSTREAQIKAMEDGTDKVLAQIKLDHDREVEAINRSYEDMRLKRIEAAKQLWESDQKNKGKNFYESEEFKKANVNSEAETQNFNERIKTAQVAEKKQIEDIQKQQAQSMIDYLKEYGTFQQKKLAITKEYEKKIAAAQRLGNIGEVKKLEAERNKELGTYKAQELAQGIDFSQITKGFNKMLDGIAKETYNRIQEYRKTDEYKNSLPESKQAIANLEQQLIEKGAAGTISPFGSWKEINEHSKELDEAIKRTQEAVKNHNMAVERLTAAQNDLKRAMQQGRSTFEITLLQGAVTQAEKDVQNTGEKVQQEQSNQQDKQQKLQTDFKKVDQGLSDFDQMLNQITSGSLSGFADGVSNLIALITKDDDKMGKGLVGLIGEKAGGIIGAIISIIEALGDKPVEFIESLFKKIETLVEAVLKNLPQIIGSIVEGIGGILGGLGKGILGMFGIDFGSSNREEMEKENKKLANATLMNTEALNRLTEVMKKQNPTDAYKTYEEAMRLMKLNEENMMKTLENNASIHDGGHSLSYDFKHNSGLVMYIDKDGYGYMESKGYDMAKKMYDYLKKNPYDNSYDIGSMVHDFTAEDWNRLLKEKPEWMTELSNIIASVEDSGNYNGIMQDILNFASDFSPERYEDLFISFQETITHLSFDSMYDSFVSSLMDMDKKAEDFAKDFEGYIRNAIYQAMAVDQLKEPLENWYKALANAMKSRESNGRYMSKEEIKELMETGGSYVDESGNTQTFMSYQEIMQIGTSIRDAVGELGLNENSNDKQSATFNSAQNITYEQADAIAGILTAQLIVQEQGKADLSLLTASVSQLTPLYMEQRDIAADSRDILAGMAIHVEEIRDGVVDTIVPRIKNIDNNLDKVYKLVEAQ